MPAGSDQRASFFAVCPVRWFPVRWFAHSSCSPGWGRARGGKILLAHPWPHGKDRAVLAGEQDLTGPLRDLVTTILAAGDPP